MPKRYKSPLPPKPLEQGDGYQTTMRLSKEMARMRMKQVLQDYDDVTYEKFPNETFVIKYRYPRKKAK